APASVSQPAAPLAPPPVAPPPPPSVAPRVVWDEEYEPTQPRFGRRVAVSAVLVLVVVAAVAFGITRVRRAPAPPVEELVPVPAAPVAESLPQASPAPVVSLPAPPPAAAPQPRHDPPPVRRRPAGGGAGRLFRWSTPWGEGMR